MSYKLFTIFLVCDCCLRLASFALSCQLTKNGHHNGETHSRGTFSHHQRSCWLPEGTAYTTQVSRREAMYEMEIREVLADGVVTEQEEAHLKNMQVKYGMSDEQVEAIAAQVRQ